MAAIDEQYASVFKGLRQKDELHFHDVDYLEALLQKYEEGEALGQLWEGDEWKAALSEADRRMATKAEAQYNSNDPKKDGHPLRLLEKLVKGEVEEEEDEEERVIQECVQEVIQELIQNVEESEEKRKMKEAVEQITSKMLSKAVRDLIHYSVRWVAWEQEPGFCCSYSECRAQLMKLQRCGMCQAYNGQAGPKPSSRQVTYYCGEECAALDWRQGHAAFHQVVMLIFGS